MPHNPMIQRSSVQKRVRIELMRLELKDYGYAIVNQIWLSKIIKRLPIGEQARELAEALR